MSTEYVSQATELVRLSVPGRLDLYNKVQVHQSHLYLHVADLGDPQMAATVGKRTLFGVEGFSQNYTQAFEYFRQAAETSAEGVSEALGFLGHMFALGLGVPVDHTTAIELFKLGVYLKDDPIAHNGLGYYHFHGIETMTPRDITKAVYHFNVSAAKGLPDGQYNLAVLHLTGTGVAQSFSRAMGLLIKAVEQAHVGATYLLALMHLNGLGTMKDCNVAVTLLKRVAERSGWVSKHLQKAYSFQSRGRVNDAAFIYWQLAEAGVEVGQTNLAYLLEGAGIKPFRRKKPSYRPSFWRFWLLPPSELLAEQAGFYPTSLFSLTDVASPTSNRVFAHRLWQLASDQGNAQADLRLGDYAFYGWGREASLENATSDHAMGDPNAFTTLRDFNGEDLSEWIWPTPAKIYWTQRQRPNYGLAFTYYSRASRAVPTAPWIQSMLARATYNLGYLYEHGYGVPVDYRFAAAHFKRIVEVDPSVSMMVKWTLQALLRSYKVARSPRIKQALIDMRGCSDLRVVIFLILVQVWLVSACVMPLILRFNAETAQQRLQVFWIVLRERCRSVLLFNSPPSGFSHNMEDCTDEPSRGSEPQMADREPVAGSHEPNKAEFIAPVSDDGDVASVTRRKDSWNGRDVSLENAAVKVSGEVQAWAAKKDVALANGDTEPLVMGASDETKEEQHELTS